MVSSTLALLFFFFPDFPIVSRAAAQCPVEYRENFVRPSIRPSVHLFGVLSYLLAWKLWPGGLGLGLKALGPRPEALPWRPAHKVETMAWRPKPGGLQD